jgi:hypothetical protein
MKKSMTAGSIWKVSKVALLSEKPMYISSTIKSVINMNASKFSPVLQSTVKMPKQVTPPEDLATLLSCPPGQRVDVLALLTGMGEPTQRQTAMGNRVHVETTWTTQARRVRRAVRLRFGFLKRRPAQLKYKNSKNA